MEYRPHPYQKHAAEHIMNNPAAGLFLEMGLGKTVATLTAINELMYESFEVDKVLVIAPLRVAESTWTAEIGKWDHLKHLTTSKVLGPEKQRKQALRKPADIYLINRENVPWLIGYCGSKFPFDMIVVDELSSFKSHKAARFKTLKQVRPAVKRVVGLTGTPAPNSLIDLWPQVYLLDMGARLEKTISSYRTKYFRPGRTNGQVVFNYKLNDGSQQEIYHRIEDICISMKAEDYLQIPERIDNIVGLDLPEEIMKRYLELEKEAVLALPEGEITALNAAALTTKLLQLANGACYDADRNVVQIHDLKMDALEEVIEGACGKPVLVFYTYKHDLYKIQKKFKQAKTLESADDIDRWNAGEIPILLAHPASAGHGLNLQFGGSTIVWYGLTWSLELYQQANARLYRQGQKNSVVIHHLVTKGTMDEQVMAALEGKAIGQDALMDAVKARIEKYKGEKTNGSTMDQRGL